MTNIELANELLKHDSMPVILYSAGLGEFTDKIRITQSIVKSFGGDVIIIEQDIR